MKHMSISCNRSVSIHLLHMLWKWTQARAQNFSKGAKIRAVRGKVLDLCTPK